MVELFDYAVSNPPYQKTLGGSTVLAIYPAFIQLGSLIAERSIMIHPARAFKKAGRYVKEDVEKILENKDFSIVEEFVNEKELFPNTQIKGGVIISKHISSNNSHFHNTQRAFNNLFPEHLTNIKNKVYERDDFVSIRKSIYSFLDNRISEFARTELADCENMRTAPNNREFKTNVFSTIPELFVSETEFAERLRNGEIEETDFRTIVGYSKVRLSKFIDKRFVNFEEKWNGWKVFVPNSSTVVGSRIGEPVIGNLDSLNTQTFITFGMFDTEFEAVNCAKYVKTVFARGLLKVLKSTQHNARKTWLYVPVQDFSEFSDIEWNGSVRDIDEQLFKKYGLSEAEIEWLFDNVDEMI